MKTSDSLLRALGMRGFLADPDKPLNGYSYHPVALRELTHEDYVTGATYEAWLLESLYTALTHVEPLIAARALWQAFEYRGRVRSAGSLECDALLEARNRVEAWLRPLPNQEPVS